MIEAKVSVDIESEKEEGNLGFEVIGEVDKYEDIISIIGHLGVERTLKPQSL